MATERRVKNEYEIKEKRMTNEIIEHLTTIQKQEETINRQAKEILKNLGMPASHGLKVQKLINQNTNDYYDFEKRLQMEKDKATDSAH